MYSVSMPDAATTDLRLLYHDVHAPASHIHSEKHITIINDPNVEEFSQLSLIFAASLIEFADMIMSSRQTRTYPGPFNREHAIKKLGSAAVNLLPQSDSMPISQLCHGLVKNMDGIL